MKRDYLRRAISAIGVSIAIILAMVPPAAVARGDTGHAGMQSAVSVVVPPTTTITEGADDVTLTVPVQLSFPDGEPFGVEVRWNTVPGSATQDVDYAPASGVLSFQPGETTLPLSMVVRGDNESEAHESFVICFTADPDVDTCQSSTEVTIRDDDSGDRPPLPANDIAATRTDTSVTIAVLENDIDPDGNPLTLASAGTPAHGTASFDGQLLTYTPHAGFEGVDHFLYTVSNGTASARGAVSVYVGAGPAPLPSVLTITPPFLDFGVVPLNKTRDIIVTVTNSTDNPVGLAETWLVAQRDPSPFDVELDGCARVRILNPGDSCTRRVRYWAVPNSDAASPATLQLLHDHTFDVIAIVPLFASLGPPDEGPNAPPTVEDDLASGLPAATHYLNALQNDSDPDDDLLRITAVSDPPHGTATITSCGVVFPLNPNEDCIQYIADEGYRGIDFVRYTVSDGRGGTASATYHLGVGDVVPIVSSITPDSGPITGGQSVRVTGTNFLYRSNVAFDCSGLAVLPLNVTSLTEHEILAITPAGFPSTCDVRVRTAFGQTGTLSGGYRYAETPSLTLSAVAPVLEGGILRFAVRLDHPAPAEVTVRLATEDGTAFAPGDYVALPETTVTLAAGQTEAFVEVTTLADVLNEANESVAVRILGTTGPVSAALQSAVGTILDATPDPIVSIADLGTLEGLPLQFTVSLLTTSASDITVVATTADGTAVGDADYTARSEQLVIPAGRISTTFTVPTTDDTLDEPTETVLVTLSDAVGATIGDGTATATIVDKSNVRVIAPAPVLEGGTLQFVARLDHPAASQVTVRLATQDGTAQAPADYVARPDTTLIIAAGETEALFEVATSADFLQGEGDETVVVRIIGTSGPVSPVLLAATGTIQDKPPVSVRVHPASATEGTPLMFPVRLSEARPGSVSVTLATLDGSAQASGDYTAREETIIFSPGQTEAMFVVSTVDDGFDEPDETVTARITRAINVSLNVFSASGTILDNDEPLPVVSVHPPVPTVEGSPLRFPVRLDRAGPGPIDIRLSTADGSAHAPADYVAQNLTLVRIPAGATEAFLEVPTVLDLLVEGNETVTVRIQSTINASLSVLTASGTILDAVVIVNPRPTVTINQAATQSDPATSAPINFTVVFSEPVTGFGNTDIAFAGSTIGGTLAATVTGSGANYNVAVSGMTGVGTVTVSIPGNAAVDSTNLPSTASTSTDATVLFGLSTVVAVVSPGNGGNAALTLLRTSNQLNGILFYARGTITLTATRFTSFVINGQTATLEGFSTNNRFFVVMVRDGGPGQADTFRLWIEGVEQTAGGALSSGTVLVQPWTPDTRLKGWVDLHTHPMSNLAFGGKLFHGAPSVGSLMPAMQLPGDAQCRPFDQRVTSIAEALSQDAPTRGDGIQSRCGDFTRNLLIKTIESFNGAQVAPAGADGFPSFTHWPKWNDITHQKMWVDWIRRAWEGGQRVMVALSHNNRTLASMLGAGGPISGVRDDRASSDLQIEEIKQLVAAHADFMAVARTADELHAIVRAGRLAVVLGVEIDRIGDFSAAQVPTELAIDDEIAHLYAQGVRYILPVHFVDNAIGDAALQQPLYNILNLRENNTFFTVGCAPFSDDVGYRSGGIPAILFPFQPPGMPVPTTPGCTSSGTFLGHINARSADGLSARGAFAIRAMMRRGIIVDIDHMSNRAANRTLAIANAVPGGGYPITSGHSGIRERSNPQFNSENSRSTAQLARIACLGGMFGLGTDSAGAHRWAALYERGYNVMRRAFAPGGLCPGITPLGAGFVGLGTDANSLVKTPVPPLLDPAGTPRFADIYNATNPLNAGVPPLAQSTTGTRTWDYNLDGVAHYGMFVDFLRDVRMWNPTGTMPGTQIVDEQMMYGAEYFFRMWQKAETQKVRVP